MTANVGPGNVLDGRYQLEEQVGEQGRAALWRGTDTILARAVAILILPSTAPETPAVLTAARRASRISDPRFLQVFDTATLDDVTYVVTEWVTGRTLTDLLLEAGPLPAERAGALICEAAEALATAHDVGVTHLHLHPDNVVWTSADGVKITGVAIEAALAGITSDDPARADAEGLGALLYAALTARWPYGPYRGLPAAPHGPGAPRPHQVRAGIPPELDSTTERALSGRPARGQPSLASPAEVADALTRYPDPAPLDLLFAGADERSSQQTGDGDTDPLVPVPPGPRHPRHPRHPRRPHRARQHGRYGRAVVAIPVAVLVIVLVGIGGWRLGTSGLTVGQSPPASSPGSTATSGSPSPSESSTPAGRHQFPIVAAHDFDPLGDGSEHPGDVDKAYDGTKRTAWQTDTYNSADLGNLKPGVGLVFDLGSPRDVSSVKLRLVGHGTDVQLRAADSMGNSPGHFDRVAKADDTGENVTLRPDRHNTARYWLVWITKLPKAGDGYRAEIADVTFKPAG